MKKRAIECAADKEAVQEAERSKFLKEIRFLTQVLHAPENLFGLFRVVDEFQQILTLFTPIAGEGSRNKLHRLDAIIESIQANHPRILELFPDANPKNRKTLKDYYETNPHYAIYWNRPKESVFAPHLRALLASLLPVRIKLDQARINEPETFAAVATKFNRYLRRLSAPTPKERQLLLYLPICALTPVEFGAKVDQVCEQFGFRLKRSVDLETFYFIRRVIDWFDDGVWKDRSGLIDSYRSGVVTEERRRGATETVDTESRVELDTRLDDDSPVRGARYFERPNEATKNAESFDPDQIEDGTPTAMTIQLDSQKVDVYHLQNRRRQAIHSARFKAQAIEISNQHLPVGRSNLSGHELACFLATLDDLTLPTWDPIPKAKRSQVAAWAACRFFLSRDENQLRKMRAATVVETPPSPEEPIWEPPKAQIALSAIPPKHQRPSESANTVPVSPHFSLTIPDFFTRILRRLPITPGRMFPEPCENNYGHLLNSINARHGLGLSPIRLQSVVTNLMSNLAPTDRVISIYFQGLPPNQHNPAVYSVVTVGHLQALFDQSCKRIGERAGRPLMAPVNAELPGLFQTTDTYVGSLHVPRREAVHSTAKTLQSKLAHMAARPAVPIPLLHNTYTAYVALFLLATSGVRAVSSLLPAEFDLDPQTGICFISDKDNRRYGNAHLAWLHPLLVQQIALYKEHTTRLRQTLALLHPASLDRFDHSGTSLKLSSHLAPDRNSDREKLANSAPALFFLSSQGAGPFDISPSQLAGYLGPDWALRVGALRHFVRSHLLNSNCSGEMINALLGHGDRGEAAWSDFSTLPPLLWRQYFEKIIAPCIKRLGFVAIRSPLLGAPC